MGESTVTADLLFAVHQIEPYVKSDWLLATNGVPRQLREGGWIYLRVDGEGIQARVQYAGYEFRKDRRYRTGVDAGESDQAKPGYVILLDPRTWDLSITVTLPKGSRFQGRGYRYLTTDEANDSLQFIRIKTGEVYDPEMFIFDKEASRGELNVFEGHRRRTTSHVYERNSRARKECIAHHGPQCQVCGLEFGVRYGAHGKGFIEVHHLRPIFEAASGGPYRLDPVTDLRPVCPNCHRMIHYGGRLLTIEEARALLQ